MYWYLHMEHRSLPRSGSEAGVVGRGSPLLSVLTEHLLVEIELYASCMTQRGLTLSLSYQFP